MNSVWGNKIKYSLFGESHGKGVGITIHGLKSGIKIDYDIIRENLNRRKTGKKNTSLRAEEDDFIILSGEKNNYTTGAPLTFFIKNNDVRKKDYDKMSYIPRPSHTDYVNYIKYGKFGEYSGSGHFSARLTAPIVIAGSLIKPLLSDKGIDVLYNISQIGTVTDDTDLEKLDINEAKKIKTFDIPMYKDSSRLEAKKLLEKIKDNKDSVGGKITSTIKGLDAGFGDPFFESMESRISYLMFSIPAVKAVEFGLGVKFAEKNGSSANDAFRVSNGKIITNTNNSGGINGGITNGMPVSFCLTFRPASSIGLIQESVDLTKMENTEIKIEGRHDPCVAIRAGVIVESLINMLLFDLL